MDAASQRSITAACEAGYAAASPAAVIVLASSSASITNEPSAPKICRIHTAMPWPMAPLQRLQSACIDRPIQPIRVASMDTMSRLVAMGCEGGREMIS